MPVPFTWNGGHTLFFAPGKAYPFTVEFQAHWQEIRDEFHHLHKQSFSTVSAWGNRLGLNPTSGWTKFPMLFHGVKLEDHTKQCPKTIELIEKLVPRELVISAEFSVQSPGAVVALHNNFLFPEFVRMHLGLVVPTTDATKIGMKVDGMTINWEEGRFICFDDTFPHEVWNRTDQLRAILIIDVLRPGLHASRSQVLKRHWHLMKELLTQNFDNVEMDSSKGGFMSIREGTIDAKLAPKMEYTDDESEVVAESGDALPGVPKEVSQFVLKRFYPNYNSEHVAYLG